jgi:hypothetical protein
MCSIHNRRLTPLDSPERPLEKARSTMLLLAYLMILFSARISQEMGNHRLDKLKLEEDGQ